MGYIIDKVADIVFDSVYELGKEKLNNILEEEKLKKILANSIKGYNELQKIRNDNSEDECIINRESFDLLKKDMIMPNLTIEELEDNLLSFFEQCIRIDNKEKAKRIREYICHTYKLGVAGLISISQVDDDIHKVEKSVKESEKKVVVKIDKSKEEIIQEIKKKPAQHLVFIDELDESRVYCYIDLQLTTEIENEYLQELSDNVIAECTTYYDEQDFFHVSFNFLYPIAQCELKMYLKYLDREFMENKIGILSITSHY